MHHFHYKGTELYAEDVAVREIVEKVGTPLYLYSHATLERHYRAMDEAFAAVPHTICYSMKANSNLAVLKTFFGLGGGVDIVSGGELYRALAAGVEPGKVVYSGVGKKDDEIEYALNTGILMFNVESEEELDRIDVIAGRLGKKAGIAIRVNPDVDPETHPYITTGLKKAKFGINIERSLEQYRRAERMANLDVMGIDCHIGSQLTKVSPFVDTVKKLKRLIEAVRESGVDLRYFDLAAAWASPTAMKPPRFRRNTAQQSPRKPGTSASTSCSSRAATWWEMPGSWLPSASLSSAEKRKTS